MANIVVTVVGSDSISSTHHLSLTSNTIGVGVRGVESITNNPTVIPKLEAIIVAPSSKSTTTGTISVISAIPASGNIVSSGVGNVSLLGVSDVTVNTTNAVGNTLVGTVTILCPNITTIAKSPQLLKAVLDNNIKVYSAKRGTKITNPVIVSETKSKTTLINSVLLGPVTYEAPAGSVTPTARTGEELPDISNTRTITRNQIVQELYTTSLPNEILTTPSNRDVDFGTISNNSEVELTINNLRLTQLTVDSIILPVNYGMTISGISSGDVIGINSSLTFTLKVDLLSGDSLLTANPITINFTDDKVVFYVSVFRSPINVYLFAPDRGSYNEQYMYKTLVFSTTSKKEKRTSVISEPKLLTDYKITSTSIEDTSFIMNTLYSGYLIDMLQPRWAFTTYTTKGDIDSYNVYCDTYDGIFKKDDLIVIYLDELNETDIVVRKINEVFPTYIVVTNVVSYPSNARVLPLFKAVPNSSQSVSGATAMGQKISVKVQGV